MVLLHPHQVLTKSSDRADQKLLMVTTHEVIQKWNIELQKQSSGTEGFWVLAIKLKKKGTRPPLMGMTNPKKRLCNSLTLLTDTGARRKHIFQVRSLSEDNLIGGSCGGQVRLRRTKDSFSQEDGPHAEDGTSQNCGMCG